MTDYLTFCERVSNGEFDEHGNETFGNELIQIVSESLSGIGYDDADQIAERMIVTGIDNRGSFDGVLEYVEEVYFVLTGNTLGF